MHRSKRQDPRHRDRPARQVGVLIFASFGLNAPRNATVVCTSAVCACAIGAAVFLVPEMEGPFDGLVRVAARPVEVALDRTGR